MDIKQIRLKNLRSLISEAGTIAELARKSATAPAYLSQILNRLPSASGSARTLGDKLARKLETAMSKPFGWMDKDHNEVEHGFVHYVPLIRKEDLDRVASKSDISAEQMIPVPLSLGPRAFAYTLTDESMGPRFHSGEIVVFDPDAQLSDHQFCLYLKDGDNLPCLRQYICEDSSGVLCKALNPEYPSYHYHANDRIYGRAVYRGEFL